MHLLGRGPPAAGSDQVLKLGEGDVGSPEGDRADHSSKEDKGIRVSSGIKFSTPESILSHSMADLRPAISATAAPPTPL